MLTLQDLEDSYASITRSTRTKPTDVVSPAPGRRKLPQPQLQKTGGPAGDNGVTGREAIANEECAVG